MEVCEADSPVAPSSPVAQSTGVQHNQDYSPQQRVSPESLIEPPHILLEDDEVVSEEDAQACQIVQSLEQCCQEALQIFHEEKYVIVSKSNLVQQILDLYADDGVSGYKMRVTNTTPLATVSCVRFSPCSGKNFCPTIVRVQTITPSHNKRRIQKAFMKHWDN